MVKGENYQLMFLVFLGEFLVIMVFYAQRTEVEANRGMMMRGW